MEFSTSPGSRRSLDVRRLFAVILVALFLPIALLPIAPTANAGPTDKRCRAIVDLVTKVEGLNYTFGVCKPIFELSDGTPLSNGLQAGFRGATDTDSLFVLVGRGEFKPRKLRVFTNRNGHHVEQIRFRGYLFETTSLEAFDAQTNLTKLVQKHGLPKTLR
jgi:hypothetical protein